MALSSENNKITFTAQAGDTVFNFVLPYFDNSDINVEIERANGSIVDPSTYSFTVAAINGNTETGATVTLSSITLAANDKVTILRNVPITQQYDLQEGGTIDPVALNKALDRVVAQNQQQENKFGRTITFPETDADSITYNVDSSSTDRAGKVLGFDSSGNVTELSQIQGSASVDSSRGLQLINNQIGVKDDGITNQFIADDAVDTAQIANDAVEQAQIADNAVGTAQVANSAITKAKMENVNNMRVLGNTSGSTTAPQEVSVLAENNMISDDPDALATQQSIKAYADSVVSNLNFATDGTGSGSINVTGGTVTNCKVATIGGIVVKVMEASFTEDNDATITLASAFPNNHFICIAQPVTTNQAILVKTLTTTTFTVNRPDNVDGIHTYKFLAIGN